MWIHKRRAAFVLQAFIMLGLPFLKINGRSALRFDIPELKLYFFGTVIWMNEFYLVFLGAVLFLLILVAATNVFGRIWCGWLCPQTALMDLTQWASGGKRLVQRFALIPASAIVSFSLIAYFIPPSDAWGAVLSGHRIITGFFVADWVVIYFMLGILGRTFCVKICPYSMLQTGLFDRDTLVIGFDERRRPECMGCDLCARVCPVGIDIKEGLRRECIACAECIDACAKMTSGRNIASLISYRGDIMKPKAGLLLAGLLAIGLMFAFVIMMRPLFGVVVSRLSHSPAKGVNAYAFTIQNNTGELKTVKIEVEGPFVLIGPSEASAGPFERTAGRLMLRLKDGAKADTARLKFSFRGEGITREAGFF